jgi:quinol monooxygenase YgiN/phenylpyruvate tautomerase PptA (4-oxalocrotonate tautomerase family)
MPVIMIHTLELLEEQKKVIAQKYTEILAAQTKVPPERIYVFFSGYPLDGIAAGGVLNSDVPASALKQFVTKYTADLRAAEPVTVVTRLKARVGQVQTAHQALARLESRARTAAGCVSYTALQCADPTSRFMLHETWKDRKARDDAYMESGYYKEFKSARLFEVVKEIGSVYQVLAAEPYTGPASMPSPATIVTRMTAKDGMVEAAQEELVALTASSREEAGCYQYNMYQGISDPSVFVEDEVWAGPQAVEFHFGTDYFKHLSGNANKFFKPTPGDFSPFEVMLCTPELPLAHS